MTARWWVTGDSEPEDRLAVVDSHGVTWAWRDQSDDDDPGPFAWTRLLITRFGSGWATGFATALDWFEVCGYGPLREATADEADSVTVVGRDPSGSTS